VVDVFVATGYIVSEVPNVFYFQAWKSPERIDFLDFSEATLRQSYRPNATMNISQAIVSNISTINKGKGSFIFTPFANATDLTLEVNINGQVIRRNLAFVN
jgi:hypothetical protein